MGLLENFGIDDLDVALFFVDIDECVLKRDGCMHVCTNNVGGYTCSCNKYFNLTNDGKTCEGNNNLRRGWRSGKISASR